MKLFLQVVERSGKMNLIWRRFASKMPSLPPLITPCILHEQMKMPKFPEKFRIIDATWDFSSSKRNLRQEHSTKRIPNARFFDLDECSDRSLSLPHMLPKANQFEQYVTELGVTNHHHVIVYDNSEQFGLFSSPRVWWTFKVFGHDKVSVLDGGLPNWLNEGYPTESGENSLVQNNGTYKIQYL